MVMAPLPRGTTTPINHNASESIERDLEPYHHGGTDPKSGIVMCIASCPCIQNIWRPSVPSSKCMMFSQLCPSSIDVLSRVVCQSDRYVDACKGIACTEDVNLDCSQSRRPA